MKKLIITKTLSRYPSPECKKLDYYRALLDNLYDKYKKDYFNLRFRSGYFGYLIGDRYETEEEYKIRQEKIKRNIIKAAKQRKRAREDAKLAKIENIANSEAKEYKNFLIL